MTKAELVEKIANDAEITRAKTAVEIWGSEIMLVNTISRIIDRKSGLRDALWRCNSA